jgi:hypothetical protein
MILKRVKLEELDALACWEFLFNQPIRFGQHYCNPMRSDKSPGCKFFQVSGTVLFVDHSTKVTYNIGTAAAELYGCSYAEALQRLYLKVGVSKRTYELREDIRCKIEVVSKPYSKRFLEYWEKLGVKEWQLKREKTEVVEVESFKIKWESSKTYYPNDLVFCYKGKEGAKLYFPFRKKPRFKSSLKENDVWEIRKNPDWWVITKSHKDVLVLESILEGTPYEDFSITHVQSEGSCPKNKDWKNATRLITLLDNDGAGRKASDKLKEEYLNAELRFLISDKDISDLINLVGYEKAKEELINVLNDD